MDLAEEIDRLYGTPLDEFVRERDGLARRLTRDGDREGGARVKALRKPTVGAWALNQAVRRRRAETDALLATGKLLRAAHEDLLNGGDPAVLRETMEKERSLTSALADCAEAIASETGKSGPALRDRVRATLHAAAVQEEAREELAAGRFTREREAVGLGPFGSELAAGGAPSEPAERRAPERRGGRTATKRGRTASGRERRAAGGRESAAGRGAAAKRGAAAERAAAERAEAERAALPDPRFVEAERSLAEAREALTGAEADHAATLTDAESAKEALEDAEAAEREARRMVRELEREVAKQERRVERMRPKS
jgi:hypothetical protein